MNGRSLSEHTWNLLIGLSGHAENGKDTTAQMATELLKQQHPDWRITTVGFAEAVKNRAREQGWNGEKDEAGRSLLQRIGTEGRNIYPNYWIDQLLRDRIKIGVDPEVRSVWFITDMRYLNEAIAVRTAKGLLWRIIRINPDGSPFMNRLTPEQRLHPSETDLDNFDDWDAVIVSASLGLKRRLIRQTLWEAHLL